MEPAAQVLHWEQHKASKGHQTGSVTSSIHISISYMLILEGRGRSEAISANTGHVASQSQAWCAQTVQSDFKATTGDRKEGNKGLSLHPVLHKKSQLFPHLFSTLYITVCTVILVDTQQMAFVRHGEQELTQSSPHPLSNPSLLFKCLPYKQILLLLKVGSKLKRIVLHTYCMHITEPQLVAGCS